MDIDLSCQVCSELYESSLRDPVMLPVCGHTFCRPCLVSIRDAKKTLKCPTCRKKHTGTDVAQLTVNFLALNLLESNRAALTKAMAAQELTISAGSQKKEVLLVNQCSVHGDPLKLWCCSCQEDICGQCLYENHMGQRHTVISAQFMTDEIKGEIDVRASSILQCLEIKKEGIAKDLHELSLKLSRAYNESVLLHNYTSEVASIVNITNASKNVKHQMQYNSRLQKLQTQVEKMLFIESVGNLIDFSVDAANSVKKNNPDQRSQDSSSGDNVTEDDVLKEHADEHQDTTMWPLVDCAPGGSDQWPMINWVDFVRKLPVVNLLVPLKSPEISLLLSHGSQNIGCVTIRLWSHVRRAQQFLMLCLGTLGPTYKGMTFNSVVRKGQPGEALVGGNYKIRDETQHHGLLSDLEWGGMYSQKSKTGIVTAWSNGIADCDSWFAIITRVLPGSTLSCPFGEVISGMDAVKLIVENYNPKEISITSIQLK